MGTKSNLTNDELRDDIRAGLLEAESRLLAGGKTRILQRFKRTHLLFWSVEEDAHEDGALTTLSGGSDKGDGA